MLAPAMAYDLIVTVPRTLALADAREHAEALARLPAARKLEQTVHPLEPVDGDPEAVGDRSLLSLGVVGDDAAVAKLWRALVREAKARGLGLVDPQYSGDPVDLDEPGRYPPGWIPNGVSGKTLAAKAKALFVDHLRARGFRPAGKWMASRDFPGLRQGVQVLPSRRSDAFTLDLVWEITIDEPPAAEGKLRSFDGSVRIGELCEDGVPWYEGPLERAFERARRDLFAVGLPYLDRYADVGAIVDAYRSGELLPHRAFGADPGWQQFNLGLCCELLGRVDEAAAAYEAVFTHHANNHLALNLERLRAADPPDLAVIRRVEADYAAFTGGPDDWVGRRAEAARARLAALRA